MAERRNDRNKAAVLEKNTLKDLSFIGGKSPVKKETFDAIVAQFSHLPQIKTPTEDNELDPYFVASDTGPSFPEIRVPKPSEHLKKSAFYINKSKKTTKSAADLEREEQKLELNMAMDEQGFDIGSVMNSGRIVRLKMDMEEFPDMALDLHEFTVVMQKVIIDEDAKNFDERLLLEALVETFHKIDIYDTGKVSFDMFSAFLIDQEVNAEMTSQKSLHYHAADIYDESRHDNYIDRLYYFSMLDKLALFEQNMKILKIYNAETLKYENSITVKTGIVLAAEHIPEYNVIAISCSDKSLNLYDVEYFQLNRTFYTPDSQQCLLWSKSHEILFSAGIESKIYGWQISKAFSFDHKYEDLAYTDLLAPTMPWKEDCECIMYLLELTAIGQLASASVDRKIRLWDIKFDENLEPRKILEGHTKAIKQMTYSAANNILISCGFEFEVLVWNPYVAGPICPLIGHEAPIVGVVCPPSNPSIVSADSNGVIKMWDLQDYSLIQTFYVPNILQLKAIVAVPQHRRLVAASRKLHVFEYDRPFIPDTTDDNPIFCACYNSENLQILIAGTNSIKVWNATTGRPIRIIQDLTPSEITAMVLDDSNRKVIIGDHAGNVVQIDANNGAVLNRFNSHTGEVTGIIYVGKKLFISTGWDKRILIHVDSRETRKGPVREVRNAHSQDIICLAYTPILDLIATGARDCTVRLWDFETMKLENIFHGHTCEIYMIKFLDPYPLIVVSDSSGTLSIWALLCETFDYITTPLVKWENMHNLETRSVVTAITHCELDDKTLIATGDEQGTIRLMDITPLIQEHNIPAYKKHPLKQTSRNPLRYVSIDMSDAGESLGINKKQQKSEGSLRSQDSEAKKNPIHVDCDPIMEENAVKTFKHWKAHTDTIKYICIIRETESPSIFSTGLDQMARLWNTQGVQLGSLKQGNRGAAQWEFKPFNKNTRRGAAVSQIIEQKMKTLENLNISQATASKTERDKNEVLDEFTKLNLRLVQADPTPITAVDLLKDITEVESWLPQDERYEQLKDSRSLRPKKNKLISKRT